MTLNIKLTSVSGNPYGDWKLYMRDESGTWVSAADFRIDEEMTKAAVDKVSTFDNPITFTGLAIIYSDSAGSTDYNLEYELKYTGVQVKNS